MEFQELLVLLPCHSLEDFPLYHEGEAAEGLLSAWSALWRPELIASAKKTPTWRRADEPPAELDGRLLVVPTVVQSELPAGFAARAKAEGACLIRKLHRRDEIVAAALADLGRESNVPPALAADFLALGLCYLWVELLTRRMRYTSNLDQVHFQNQAVAAAEAAGRGDEAAVREHLTHCFDALAEVRGHYYGVDAYFLDLTLVAPTTLGQSLRDELAAASAINLLMTAEVVEQMAREEPATLAAVRSALEEGRASIVGGEFTEEDLPLLPPERILAQLERGRETYQKNLGRAPQVFGRRRFGLTPSLPQLLAKSGFRGALHVTLDDGQFPAGERSKTRWEGADGTAIDAMGRVPLDATQPASFLNLPERLGESMDLDMVATVCFAHWPGQYSPFFEDLRRMSAFTAVIGKFVTVDHYFANTASSGLLSRFEADRYRSPYLQQAIIRRKPDPLSTSVRMLRDAAAQEAGQTLAALAQLLSGDANPSDESHKPAERLAKILAPEPGAGYLTLNPLSFARRVGFEAPALTQLPALVEPVHAADDEGGTIRVVAEAPGLGFAWVGPGESPRHAPHPRKTLAKHSEHLLRNDFCEVLIGSETGGIQSIHDYQTRGNRLSQQIALRLPQRRTDSGGHWRDPDEDAVYSRMVAESIETTRAGAALGEIVSRGRLQDSEDRRLSGFQQTTRLWLGSRVVEIDIELDPGEELRADPWNSYYAVRWAWSDAGAELRRSVNLGSHPTDIKRLEAPHFVEIRSDNLRTAVLTGGLPYHLRMGMRMLDSLLIVRGESARSFRLGIGIDLPSPTAAALELLAPPVVLPGVSRPPNLFGWFFHLDARSVIVTHLAPLIVDGRVAGFRARLLETQGRATKSSLRCFRAPAAARQTDFLGEPLGLLPIEEDRIQLQLGAHEWLQLEATWA